MRNGSVYAASQHALRRFLALPDQKRVGLI